MQLPGSWDIGFSAWLFERYDLFHLIPCNNILITPNKEIRVATTSDQEKVVMYMPYPVPLDLQLENSKYIFEGIALDTRQIFHPETSQSQDGSLFLEMPDFNADILLIGIRLQ